MGATRQITGHSQSVSSPSLRGRLVTRLVRMVIKRWPRNDLAAVVRRARWIFGSPGWFSFLHERGVEIQQESGRGVAGEWVIPQEPASKEKVLLYLHGGGYVSCSPRSHRAITCALARLLGWRVFCPDYRLAPEHPFPAAVDDAAAAFQWLVQQGIEARNIAVAGDSAGGGLVIAACLRLRGRGEKLPGCAVCFSPWVDLTGEFGYRNGESCAMFRTDDIGRFAGLYLGNAPANAPEASPLFGDLSGLPPLLIQASGSELLLDDALRLHERAQQCGVASNIRIYPGLPHVWQVFMGTIPEARQALREAAEFIRDRTRVSLA